MIAAVSGPRVARAPVEVSVGGVRLHALTESGCIEHILRELDAGRGGRVETMNLEHLRLNRRDPLYAAVTARAELRVADGMPLVWASRVLGTPLPERVTGANLVWSLSSAAAQAGRSIFLLGGAPGTAALTAERLMKRDPALRIAGVISPLVPARPEPHALADVGRALRDARPDIVYVALGAPKQELVMDHLRDLLPGTWWLGVGAAFDFASGAVPRAPAWMQNAGLEWMHRLAHAPRRLARRYAQGIPLGVRLLGGAVLSRIAGSSRSTRR